MTKSEICRGWREKHPDYPSLKLARIIFAKDGQTFTSVEDARGTLRYIEGKRGVAHRKKVESTKFIKTDDRARNPYQLPPSDEKEFKPFILNHKKILIMADIHIPFHSIPAITAVFDFAKKEKPDAILLNGDTLDFYGLSRFVKDPRQRNFADELNYFKEFMAVIKKTFPYAKLYFKIGNHEARYFHYLWMKAGELAGVEEFELDNIIKARVNGITIIPDKKIMCAGSLNIIHGHEFNSGFFSPVNVARGLYLRGKTSALQAHQHQSSEHTEPDMNGKITTTWSIGCLCDLHPEYSPINKWAQGFAMVDVKGKDFNVRNYRISNGKII